ncbi:MAG TPA: adenylate/guanylate cyclase domain-containing protein [Solirubrobacteraceae bacterium]
MPKTQYARHGECSLAYQVAGEGPVDLLFVPGLISHVEHMWEEPSLVRFFGRLSGVGRLILMDRRGTGLSDPTPPTSGLDEEIGDLDAVLDAIGSEKVALFGYTTGGPLCVKYAVERADRVSHLLLYACVARTLSAPGYDFTHDEQERAAQFEQILASWGDGTMAARVAPSAADDPRLVSWFARLERLSASPGTLRTIIEAMGGVDVRDLLPRVTVPTLIAHRRGDELIDVRHSQYMAEHIPAARYVELDGTDSLPSIGDTESLLGEIEEFLTGERSARAAQRALRTILFTDIVDATTQASQLGDARWRDLLASHDATVRRQLERYDGHEVKTTGDGFLATFAGPPSAAVRCARAIVEDVEELGVRIRVGLHAGECELIGDDVGGMAVHIAARVCGISGDGEILVSGTVWGTVVGSGLRFEHRGLHDLKGVPESWPIFSLVRAEVSAR